MSGDQGAPSVGRIKTPFFRMEVRLFFLGVAYVRGMGEFGRTDAESRVPYSSVFPFSGASGAEWMLLLRNRQDVRRGRPRCLAV